jgi:hypothetical protein
MSREDADPVSGELTLDDRAQRIVDEPVGIGVDRSEEFSSEVRVGGRTLPAMRQISAPTPPEIRPPRSARSLGRANRRVFSPRVASPRRQNITLHQDISD